MKKLKKICSISSLKYITAFLIPAIFLLLTNHYLDNDSWGVLAEGREILQNGVYYTDMLSMHEGLNVTVQNYGFAVLFYLVFECLGASGIYVCMMMLNFAVCLLLYKICKLISKENVNLSLMIMVVTDLILALGFVVTRAQMLDYVFFLGLIYALELYIKTGKCKYLWWAPIISILQVNLHASVWWMLICVMLVYIVDSIKNPKLHLQGYKTKPLIAALVGAVALGFVNPYGVDMIVFILRSYGDARFHDYIQELQSFSPLGSVLEGILYLSIVVVLVLYIFGDNRRVRVRYLLMFFGFLAIGLNTIKGMSQFILVMFFPLALLYKDMRIEKIVNDTKEARNALVIWAGIVSMAVFMAGCLALIPRLESHAGEVLVKAVDAIDENAGGSGGQLRVYTNYSDGGYVEYRGHKAYLDPRGEVFLKKINGKENILYEYLDFIDRKVTTAELLEKYSFDYILERWNDPFWGLDDERYEKVFEDAINGIVVYGRVQ